MTHVPPPVRTVLGSVPASMACMDPTREPPTHEELVAACAQLRSLGATRSRRLEFHLATPVDVAVGVDATITSSVSRCRGTEVPHSGDAARDALELVSTSRRPGDRFLDVNQPRSRLVKLLRSGTFLYAFGAVELGLPACRFEVSVPTGFVPDTLEQLGAAPPFVLRRDGVCVLVSGGPDAWSVVAA